jgi:hypothetical protein
MNATQIANEVLNNKKSLIYIARKFGGNKYLGIYVKDTDGTLTKVHGKSANLARKELVFMPGVVRSYGKAHLVTGEKKLPTFMVEYSFAPELLKSV